MNAVWGQDVREGEEGHISERCKQVAGTGSSATGVGTEGFSALR